MKLREGRVFPGTPCTVPVLLKLSFEFYTPSVCLFYHLEYRKLRVLFSIDYKITYFLQLLAGTNLLKVFLTYFIIDICLY